MRTCTRGEGLDAFLEVSSQGDTANGLGLGIQLAGQVGLPRKVKEGFDSTVSHRGALGQPHGRFQCVPVQVLCRAHLADLMKAYPVSQDVNNVRNQGAELIEPVGEEITA